jgi:hypothetical protein
MPNIGLMNSFNALATRGSKFVFGKRCWRTDISPPGSGRERDTVAQAFFSPGPFRNSRLAFRYIQDTEKFEDSGGASEFRIVFPELDGSLRAHVFPGDSRRADGGPASARTRLERTEHDAILRYLEPALSHRGDRPDKKGPFTRRCRAIVTGWPAS